jgi:hypothetical protein
MTPAYAKQIRTILTPRERNTFAKLRTPRAIQDFLDRVPINWEEDGRTALSPRRVLRENLAHCFEAAVLAAACLAYHGRPALLIDLQTEPADYDHVVAVFREGRLWGAISKTNRPVLRWRDPVYRSVRELAMSYFHEYFMANGRKTLRAVSRPFDLRRYPPALWVTAEEDLDWLTYDLDVSPHAAVVPTRMIPHLRDASRVERKALKLTEWRRRR